MGRITNPPNLNGLRIRLTYPMLLYLIQITAFWLVGWLLYRLILSKETFHQWNRLYLLTILLLGIGLPLLEVASPIATMPTFLLPEQVITASPLVGGNCCDHYQF